MTIDVQWHRAKGHTMYFWNHLMKLQVWTTLEEMYALIFLYSFQTYQVWFWFNKEGSWVSENFFYTPWPKESTDCETAGKSHGLQQLQSMGVSNKTMTLQDNANPGFLCS